MAADQYGTIRGGGGGELSGNDGPGSRVQRRSQMLLIFDKDKVLVRGRVDAGNATDFPWGRSNQARLHGISDLLERALHASQYSSGTRRRKKQPRSELFNSSRRCAGAAAS